jgi:hypothetical protein
VFLRGRCERDGHHYSPSRILSASERTSSSSYPTPAAISFSP